MTFRRPKGTDDILPPASQRWRRLVRLWDEMAERYGYAMVLTPVFEATEVFARSVGEDNEVVEKQMYTFEDKSGRSMSLRPEQTASVVRAYLQAGLTGPFKASYWGPQFRYEQPQKGRRRQFHQLGLEYIGEDAPQADVEVIELGYRFLVEAGLDEVEVLVNSIGGPGSRPGYRAALTDYLEERRDQLSRDSQKRIETNPMRVLDSKVDGPKLEDAPTPLDYLDESDSEHFKAVEVGLDRLRIPHRPAPRLVRGLDYYTRTVFEYVPHAYEAAHNSVGGGGRYDGLAEVLGGPATPGIGVALGLDRILLAIEDASPKPALDLWVVVADDGLRSEALAFLSELRAAGLRADTDLGARSVKAQFRAADRRRARAVAVVGEEWRDGKVTVRDLGSGDQEIIAKEEVAAWAGSR